MRVHHPADLLSKPPRRRRAPGVRPDCPRPGRRTRPATATTTSVPAAGVAAAATDATSAWGTGANVEAKLLQLLHAFEAWSCRRVEFKTDASNERSRGALTALGATFEGVHRKHMLVRRGENRDSAWFSVTDDEWSTVRARLEARLAET